MYPIWCDLIKRFQHKSSITHFRMWNDKILFYNDLIIIQ